MANELPEGLTEAQADAWFGKKTSGRFNPNGALSQLWLGLGRFPTLEAVDTAGTREIYRFADGTVVVRPEGGAPSVLAGEGGLPAGVGAARVAGWYGTATADGHDYAFAADHPVGKLWLGLGRYPRLESVANVGEARYFRYADGTVIYRPTADTHGYRVLGENTSGGTYPEGMNEGLAEQWFGTKTTGRFNPSGAVGKLWLRLGRFPTLEAIDQEGEATYYRFADGTVIVREKPGEEPYVVGAEQPQTGTGTQNGRVKIREIIGGLELNVSQGFGPTDFDYDYTYCHEYGIPDDVHTHCAMDFSVPYGTDLFAPGNATVICTGTSNDCAAFQDEGGGVGRLEFEFADGTRVIYGHASECSVQRGQQITPGQRVGASGTAGTGAHLHLEVRVPDQSTRSGLRTVDPCEFFGGC